jgi:hypothetical protein
MALNPLMLEVQPNNISTFSSYSLSKLNRLTNYCCLGKLLLFLLRMYEINKYAVGEILFFDIKVDDTAALQC